jgi:Tol biopolymer transport system component
LWSGDGSRIIVQSNRGGQIDLWEVDPDSGHTTALTSSQPVEIPEGTSADGRIVSYQQVFEDARLWAWDLTSNISRQVSAPGLNEATPDASRDGRVVAIQRRKPTELEASLVEATLLAGAFDPAGNFEPAVLGDGFAAHLSPDGRQVAFLHRPEVPGLSSLVVQQIGSGQRRVLSRHVIVPVHTPFPAAWAEHNVEWAPDGRQLFFVDRDANFAIRRADLDAPADAPARALATVPPGGIARDVHLSPDGATLAFLTWTDRTFHLQSLDVASGVTREVASITGRPTAVYHRGWLANGRDLVVVRALDVNEDLTATVEVLIVNVTGGVRKAAVIDRAHVSTSRLDDTGSVWITRSEQGVHNVYRCSLATGALTRLTDNRFQGVTFSSVVPGPAGMLLGVRHEVKRDIWLSEGTPVGR